jgi:hypothetical protein
MPRRLLRYLLIGLVLLLLGGLWGFSFFLFNPFEGRYDYPIASLIPRDVGFYAAKNDLASAFDPFPQPVVLDEFLDSPSGRALAELGLHDHYERWKVKESLAELEAALADLPIHVDPLRVFGGEGLALAGKFQGNQLEKADWAVYGRTSWLGKLAVEVVANGWVDLSAQGIQSQPFTQGDESLGVALSGGQLPRPLYLARIQDVVILATNGEFLKAASALEATRGQDSFGQSAKYADNIDRAGRTGTELELYCDQLALSENLRVSGEWPNPRSKELLTALVARLFQLASVRELVGRADIDRVTTLEFQADLASNALKPFQARLYEERGFDKEQMAEVARLVPADAGVFFYLHADIGDLLREVRSVVQSIDPKAIENLEDVVRKAWNYPDLEPFIDDLDAAFRGRVAFFMRDYDFKDEGEQGPPHNDVPVPAWAVILWPQGDKLNEIRGVIHRTDTTEMLGIRGRGEQGGIFRNFVEGGAEVFEYWNELIPGTGHVATLDMQGRERYFVLTNENRQLSSVFKGYHRDENAGSAFQPLAEVSNFQKWVNAGPPSANALLWLAPKAMDATIRRIALWDVSESAGDYIDWKVERPRIEREVLAREFSSNGGTLSAEDREAYEQRVEEEIGRFEKQYLEKELPRLRAESGRRVDALEALDAGLIELTSDRKSLRLHARLAPSFLKEP